MTVRMVDADEGVVAVLPLGATGGFVGVAPLAGGRVEEPAEYSLKSSESIVLRKGATEREMRCCPFVDRGGP